MPYLNKAYGVIASVLLVLQFSCVSSESKVAAISKTSADRKTAVRSNAAECLNVSAGACAHVLRPVCASRDNGVRCVTTPCDATEEKTYPNACAACADARVYSFVAGACDK